MNIINPYRFGGRAPAFTTTWNVTSALTIPTNGAGYNCDVDWGDGTVTSHSGTAPTISHTYGSAGIKTVTITGDFPYFYLNNNAAMDTLLLTVEQWEGHTFASIASSFYGASNLTTLDSVPFEGVGSITDFSQTWRGCSSLTSFPLLDTSSGTSFNKAWLNCPSLTSFPANFFDSWNPSSILSGVFNATWDGCSSLTSFPANFFDTWNPSSILSGVFNGTWDGCSSLTNTSVENILKSIDTSGKYATNDGTSGGTVLADPVIDIDYNAATGALTAATTTAITNLKAKSWGITINGVLQ